VGLLTRQPVHQSGESPAEADGLREPPALRGDRLQFVFEPPSRPIRPGGRQVSERQRDRVIDDGRSQHVIGQGGQHFSVDGLDPPHQPVAADTRPAFPVRGASIKLRPLGAVIPRVGQPSPATDRTPGHPGQQILRRDLGFVSKRWTKVIAASPVSPPVSPAATGLTFTIDVVNVGTGLAVLVRGADFTLVYDAGSNDDLAIGANNRMLAFIRQVTPTLTTLDHVILSHPHQDHVVLLPDLFGRTKFTRCGIQGQSTTFVAITPSSRRYATKLASGITAHCRRLHTGLCVRARLRPSPACRNHPSAPRQSDRHQHAGHPWPGGHHDHPPRRRGAPCQFQ